MPPSPFSFELRHSDPTTGARLGLFHTPHGPVQTPAFMPVGTQGTVKGLTAEQIRQTGAEMILANTYHLAVRPGEDVVRDLGGLHAMTNWNGPILTDSGGFQLFSLAKQTRVTDEGATFRSHIDGSILHLTPERAVAIQEALGSDVAMVLDHVVALPNDLDVIRDACDRSVRWAVRCRDAQRRDDQALFAIVQGGLDEALRVESAERLVGLDFPGYAIGGLSVGESHEEMIRVLDFTCPILPVDKPRYLMGVGRPEDLLAAIARGVDLFDCVIPTRNGRNALAYTDEGPLRLRNKKHERDRRPLDAACPSPVRNYSRGTIRHLFAANEMLGPILLSIHNLCYYQWLLSRAREAIAQNRFAEFCRERRAGWATTEKSEEDHEK